MAEKMIENNRVSVIGEIVSGFTFSHEVFGEGFYMVDVAVNRLSDQADIIPLMVSERLLDVGRDYSGSTIEAIGQFRSYNRHEGVKNRLMLSIFVREVHFLEEFTDYTKTNHIFLDGCICKMPIYRKTPLGREIADLLLVVNRPYGKSDYIPCISWGRNARYASGFEDGYICKMPIYRKTPLGREIADLLLAVNRPYGKSDYIPCISWGRNARYASGFEVGTRVHIWGRVQSREYTKKMNETECEKRIAYEVSISKMEREEL